MRIVVRAHNARGATFARLACASTDSASLGYLRHRYAVGAEFDLDFGK